MEYRMVEVVWEDAEELGDVGWNNLANQKRDAKKPCPTMRSTVEKIPKGIIKHIEELSYCKTKNKTKRNQKK